MKKLEDIPKKSVFKVPDGYFEQLPTVIQSRMAGRESPSALSIILKYGVRIALPVAAVVIAGVFWFRPAATLESQLTNIDIDQISYYLDDTDAQNDELHEVNEFTSTELDDLEDAVYSQMDYSAEIESEELLNNIDLDNL
jgi:hypothetical protein